MATSSIPRAQQSCVACRRLKRKCDKRLPICSLCNRTSRTCDYNESHVRTTPTLEEFAALQSRLAELESRLPVSGGGRSSHGTPTESSERSFTHANSNGLSFAIHSNAPVYDSSDARPPVLLSSASTHSSWPQSSTDGDRVNDNFLQCFAQKRNLAPSMFLDIDCFRRVHRMIPSPSATIPMEVLTALSHGNTIVETASLYFETIHLWMPIISKKRIDLGVPLRNSGPDLAALFLAMKLVTSVVSDPSANLIPSLYTTSKHFLSQLELQGDISLQCLQAMVLVALYEYSHAIYPAAFMTVAACVRYVDLMGPQEFANIQEPTSWTEYEERRRVRWAVYILDRVVTLGNRYRFLAPEPEQTDCLPVDDDLWDRGDALHAKSLPVSTPLATPQPPFARLCQAAILLGRAAEHRRQCSTKQLSSLDEVRSFIGELCAFISTLESETPLANQEPLAFSRTSSLCVAWSAFFLVIDPFCCPTSTNQDGMVPLSKAVKEEEREFSAIAISMLEVINDKVYHFAVQLTRALNDMSLSNTQRLGVISPLCLDSIYCCMVTLIWIFFEGGDPGVKTKIASIEKLLSILRKRWLVAGEYLTVGGDYDKTATYTTHD